MPDGSNLILQLPRVGDPESALLPGMAAPAPQKPLDGLGVSALASIPDTSQAVPVALQEPLWWQYDIDPANGIARATYQGEVFVGGTAAGNQVATKADIASATTGVSSFNTRTGAVVLTLADVTGAGGAPLASPSFTGTPNALTAPAGSNSAQLATTFYVDRAVSTLQAASVASFNGRVGTVTLSSSDVTTAGGALTASPSFTGTPTAPTATMGTASSQLATTQFVSNAIAGGAVVSWNGRQGSVSLQLSDVLTVGGAPIASPALTGVPTVPTAAPGTATTQAASTAFVTNAITGATTGVSSFNTRVGAVTLQAADVSGVGGALLSSPTFVGTPSAPTATGGTSTTQLATTAFVANAIAGLPGVSSFNSRTGAVTLQLTDVTSVGGAPLASPVFTGTPAAPTPTGGDNSTRVATTAFVSTAIAPLATTASVAATYLPLAGGTTSGATTLAGTSGAVTLTSKGSVFDARGNFGISMTPPANAVNAPIAGFGGWGFAWGLSTENLGTAYYDGTNFRAVVAGYPSNIGIDPSGSGITMAVSLGASLAAGAVATMTTGFTFDHTGICTIGGASYPVSDPLRVIAASGQNNLIELTVTSARQWAIGCGSNGTFGINDMTLGGPTRMLIDTASSATFTGQGSATSSFILNSMMGIRYQNVGGMTGGNAIAFAWNSPNAGVVNVGVDNGAVVQGLAPVCDERMKANIAPAQFDCLGLVNQLALKEFDWLDLSDPATTPNEADVLEGSHEPVGLIAQDVFELFPSGVQAGDTTTDRLGTIWNLKPNSMISLLVGAAQQMDRRIVALEGAQPRSRSEVSGERQTSDNRLDQALARIRSLEAKLATMEVEAARRSPQPRSPLNR